ncbi:hypothetical protein [Halorarum salinum]|uniref:hypothetical protein n=1 Tax=Halorarum salinum TaxID=2743089 RepID=UPI001C52CA3E|nr:hypothetical protein [Halobaculum salinum]
MNDYGLRTAHERSYHDTGRWVISGAVVVGALPGGVVEVGRAALAIPIAFLAGGVVLNVIKEEHPEERESRWWAFAVGVVGYSAVLLLV